MLKNGRDVGPGIIRPGEIRTTIQHQPMNLAQPVTVVLQTQKGPIVQVFGGLSPVQHGALQIAGAMAAGTAAELDFDEVASRAAELSLATLRACAALEKRTAENAALEIKSEATEGTDGNTRPPAG